MSLMKMYDAWELRVAHTSFFCTDVMDIITSNPDIDPCDPVLVTGKTVLVDDDLVSSFKSFAFSFFERENIDAQLSYAKVKGYFEVSGKGTGWSTRTYV